MVSTSGGGQSDLRSPADLADLARTAGAENGLDLEPGRLVDSGWDNRVLICEAAPMGGSEAARTWILRFPRRPEVIPEVDRERKLLGLLAGRLPVAVPLWEIDTVVDGQVVVGYRALAGSPAGREPRGDGDFDLSISNPPPDAYRETLVAALIALHAIDPGVVIAATGEPAPDPHASRARARGLVERFAVELPLPVLLADHWRRQLDDDGLWRVPTVLRHADVHPEHTLVDDAGAITGIIDWTDAGLGDPAADFLDARHAFGSAFGDRLVAEYLAAGGVGDTGLRDRVELLQSIGPLGTLQYGVDVDRPAHARRATQRIDDMAARLAATGTPLP